MRGEGESMINNYALDLEVWAFVWLRIFFLTVKGVFPLVALISTKQDIKVTLIVSISLPYLFPLPFNHSYKISSYATLTIYEKFIIILHPVEKL